MTCFLGLASWRRLDVADAESIVAHSLRLSARDRWLRFLASLGERGLRERHASIDYAAARVIGCPLEAGLAAELELHPDEDGATVDLSLGVEDRLIVAALDLASPRPAAVVRAA